MAVKPACSQSPSWPMHGICSHGIFPHVETLDMNEVERLLDAVQKRESLEVVVKIYESD